MAEEDKWTPSTARGGSAFPNSKLTYKDISADFDANAITGDLDPVKNAISVKRGITNILLTSMFERLFQPELGSNLKDVLFNKILVIPLFTEIASLTGSISPVIAFASKSALISL